MDPITLILFIAIGGIMIGAGVHFIPVGGAPAEEIIEEAEKAPVEAAEEAEEA